MMRAAFHSLRNAAAGARGVLLHRPVVAVVAAATIASGCAVGPRYERPVIDVPTEYPEVAAAVQSGSALRADWWKLYNDPQLDSLIATARERNADVRLAAAQVEEAQGVLREAGAALFPEIDVNTSSNRTRVSQSTTVPSAAGVPMVRTDHRIAFSTNFELDFWGKLRSATEAARARLLSTQYGRDVVVLTLEATTAQAYFALRSLDAQIAVTRETIASREQSVRIVTTRVQAGYSSDLDLAQANLLRANAAAQLRDLVRQRAAVEHQLEQLTGKPDLRVPVNGALDLALPPLPPAGLPSTLLERRPDIIVAEQNLISANAQIGVARAAQFPTFSLTGFLGGESETLVNILDGPAKIWSIGLGLAYPVLDAGKYAARTEQAEARQRQAVAQYQKSVETAFKDVADALSNLRETVAAEADLRAAAQAAREAQRIAELRYAAGYSAFLEVLDAQRNANDAELALVRNRQQQLAYTVDFIRALGGGWTPAT
jgi:multidrug efflux system outer membrane protein